MTGRGGKPIHWAEAFGLSALVHVGLVFFALDFVRDLQLFAPPDEDRAADIIVTSLQFDNIVIEDPSNASGADGDLGEGLEAPPLEDAATPEALPALAPEPAPEPEPEPAVDPDEPETPPVETPQAVTPEALTPEPVEPEPLSAEPVEPEIAEAAPEALQPVENAPALAPEPLSPLRPDDDTIAALAPIDGGSPERLTAAAPTAAPVAVAPVTGTTTTRIAPVSTRPELTPPAPRRPAVTPPAPGSPAAVVNELVAKIRANTSDACLVAMPQQGSDGAPELVMLAADEPSITAFAADVLAGINPRPSQRGVLIDPRQCAAATFVRENTSYPAFRLSLGVVTDRLPSGEELTGAVGRAAGAYVTLLLVDDNGVVQDVGSYLTFAAGDARFSIPMRRDGTARDTSQMLIALATDSRPRTLDAQNGQLAEDFFPALKAEIGTSIPLVMIPFEVR